MLSRSCYTREVEQDVVIKETARIITRHLPRARVFLFGSRARGTADATSDSDIGIMDTREIPLRVMAQIKEEIDSLPTLRSVDVVDLRAKSEDFREQILRHAHALT